MVSAKKTTPIWRQIFCLVITTIDVITAKGSMTKANGRKSFKQTSTWPNKPYYKPYHLTNHLHPSILIPTHQNLIIILPPLLMPQVQRISLSYSRTGQAHLLQGLTLHQSPTIGAQAPVREEFLIITRCSHQIQNLDLLMRS